MKPLLTLLLFLIAPPASAQAIDCNQPAHEAVTWIDLPGQAFQALPSADGCWIFVSLPVGDSNADDASTARVGVFRRSAGDISLVRTVPVGGNTTGMVLTHDARLLVVADGRRVAFIDVARATSGDGNALLGYWDDGTPDAGRVYVNVTADDNYLFVSNENARTISVLNLAKARASGFKSGALIGRIPVGNGPVALTLSPDERYLYSTMLNMPPGADWPAECSREWLREPAPPVAQGALFVIDVARARTQPEKSVVARVPAGCTPVRVALSPKGNVAYVSVRGANTLLAFDTSKLVSDPTRALLGRVPTGPNPIGVAVVDGGQRVIVTNSNRFGAAADEAQSLLVVDAAKVSGGKAAVLGSIPAGALPREMRVTADGRTLLVVNTLSRKLQVIDIARMSYR
jgi:DNA-binding beta-propeller fold protein YncE